MTSIPQQTNTSVQTSISGAQSAARKQSPSLPPGPISTAPSVGRSSYAAATKSSISSNAFGSSNMATAIEGSMPLQHSNGEAMNGNIPSIAAMPSLEASGGINGTNTLSASTVSDHNRKPSFTFTPSGVNGGPLGGQANKTIDIQFGSANLGGGSPASGASPALANSSPGNLGVAASMNPRNISPQASPSPIPQPSASGGRPPSSLQNQGNSLVFGQSGLDSNDSFVHPPPPTPTTLCENRILTSLTAPNAWDGTQLLCAWSSPCPQPATRIITIISW
jgi:translation initiation factor 4G